MTLEFIPVTEADRSFFRHTHHVTYRKNIEAVFGWDEPTQDKFADTDFDTRNPMLLYFNGEKVGCVGSQERESDTWFGPIFILPEFQGQGIGSRVVNQFIQKADETKKPITLETLAINTQARDLYTRLGFSVTEEADIFCHLVYTPK